MKGIKKIIQWSSSYIPLFILIILLFIILQWLYSYLPLFVQYVFQVLENKNTDVALPNFILNIFSAYKDHITIILVVSLTMIIVQAIRSIMRFSSNYLQGALAQYLGFDLRVKMYNHICNLDYTYHNNMDIGDMIQRCSSDIDQVSTFVSAQVPNFINIFVTVGIGAYQVYQISPILMLISVLILPFTAISSIIYFRYCNKKFKEIEEAESKMTTIIQENVNNARVVRAFSNEDYEFKKMDAASKDYSSKNQKFNSVMAIFWGCSDFVVFLQYAITLGCGIYLSQKGLMQSSDIVAALLLMGMLIWPMRGLGRIIASFGKASVAANRINEVLEVKDEFVINGDKKPIINGNIEFEHVSFKFKDDNKHLLNDISFKIKSGQTVALVGKTGSGKSTICNLLTRLLEIDSGCIKIDGVDIKEIDKKYLRSNIKLILQDPFLFSKTVYENIAITDNNIKENDVYRAASVASIHNEILNFEKGYKTIVGEKGTTLSGGQKQRVAIARMLVTKAPVLIFDDSLSALDTQTDMMIRRALKEKDPNQTMIIITHRTTTAKEADLILVLQDGKIVQQGNHNELVKQDGLYKELWGIQGMLEDNFKKLLEKGE